jgi:hypothetical protein
MHTTQLCRLATSLLLCSFAGLAHATVTQVVVPAHVVADVYESAMAELNLELSKPVIGTFDCAEKQTIEVSTDPKLANRFHLTLGKKRYHMHPVGTSTGVIRLEDSAEGVVWLQLGNKSMLMNAKQGRRMADDCTSPPQRRLVQLMKDKPATLLFK